METDTHGAFRFITGPLSPSAEQAIARAKELAQRVMPRDQAAERTRRADEPRVTTGITLDVDPSANLVIARVVDSDTGEVIRQLPSKAEVRFVTTSREMHKYDEPSKQADFDAKSPPSTNVTV